MLEGINLDGTIIIACFSFVRIWRCKLDYKFIVFKLSRHQTSINTQKLIHTARISMQ